MKKFKTKLKTKLIKELKLIIGEIEASKKLDYDQMIGVKEDIARLFYWRTIGRERSIRIIQDRIKTLEKEIELSSNISHKAHTVKK